jgi:ubiquinone/menaquinone biosynthesis C-methylase UbiE
MSSRTTIEKLQESWEYFAQTDPLWAVLTDPDKKGNKWNYEDFFKRGQDEIRQVLTYLREKDMPPVYGAVLDFGCGVGRLTQALADYFQSAIGVDIAPTMISRAKEFNRHGKACEFIVNTNADLSIFQNNYFDFIYCNIVLQHMAPTLALSYLSEFIRVLKPSGIAIFQIPSGNQVLSKQSFVKKTIKRILPEKFIRIYRKLQGHLEVDMEMNCIDQADVIKFVEENGGRIMDVVQDSYAGPNYVSYRYCMMRRNSA